MNTNEISPASVVRDHLAPLLSPALALAAPSTCLVSTPAIEKAATSYADNGCLKEVNGESNVKT